MHGGDVFECKEGEKEVWLRSCTCRGVCVVRVVAGLRACGPEVHVRAVTARAGACVHVGCIPALQVCAWVPLPSIPLPLCRGSWLSPWVVEAVVCAPQLLGAPTPLGCRGLRWWCCPCALGPVARRGTEVECAAGMRLGSPVQVLGVPEGAGGCSVGQGTSTPAVSPRRRAGAWQSLVPRALCPSVPAQWGRCAGCQPGSRHWKPRRKLFGHGHNATRAACPMSPWHTGGCGGVRLYIPQHPAGSGSRVGLWGWQHTHCPLWLVGQRHGAHHPGAMPTASPLGAQGRMSPLPPRFLRGETEAWELFPRPERVSMAMGAGVRSPRRCSCRAPAEQERKQHIDRSPAPWAHGPEPGQRAAKINPPGTGAGPGRRSKPRDPQTATAGERTRGHRSGKRRRRSSNPIAFGKGRAGRPGRRARRKQEEEKRSAASCCRPLCRRDAPSPLRVLWDAWGGRTRVASSKPSPSRADTLVGSLALPGSLCSQDIGTRRGTLSALGRGAEAAAKQDATL